MLQGIVSTFLCTECLFSRATNMRKFRDKRKPRADLELEELANIHYYIDVIRFDRITELA